MKSLVARWRERLNGGGLSIYTLKLKRLLRNIAAASGAPNMCAEVPRCQPPQARTTVVEPQDLRKLIDAAKPWLRTIILLAAHAGLRGGDCLRIAPIHYNAEARTLAIKQQKTRHPVVVPVSDELAQTLEAAPAGPPDTPFYELYRGKPVSHGGMNTAWRALKKKCRVDAFLWIHDLRRTLAVSLYEVSKDLRVVEQMLGHKTLGSTVRYLEHRDPAKLRPYLQEINKPYTGRIQ